MTVMFLNGKGGAGKTTLSVLFALALHDSGHRPAVRDLDPQQTATRWLELAEAKGEFVRHEQPNVTIFDTPPRLDAPEVLKTVRLAEKLILVSSPSPADLFATKDTIRRVVEPGGRAGEVPRPLQQRPKEHHPRQPTRWHGH